MPDSAMPSSSKTHNRRLEKRIIASNKISLGHRDNGVCILDKV